jgi:hypothetical protein
MPTPETDPIYIKAKPYTLDGRITKTETVDEDRLLRGLIRPAVYGAKAPGKREMLVEYLYRRVCLKHGRTP